MLVLRYVALVNHKTSLVAGYGLLVVLLTAGAASSAPGHDFIFSNDIAKGAVDSSDIKNGAIASKDVHKRAIDTPLLADGAVTGLKIADRTIAGVDLSPEVVDVLNRTHMAVVSDNESDPKSPTLKAGDASAVLLENDSYSLVFGFDSRYCAFTATPALPGLTVAASAESAPPALPYNFVHVSFTNTDGRRVRSSFTLTLICPAKLDTVPAGPKVVPSGNQP
jgi:hypothetical protein